VHENGQPVQKELSSLEREIVNFKKEMGGHPGLTAREKKSRAESLLHKLREDRDGAREIREEQSKKHRDFLKFVLDQAEKALQHQRR